MNRRTCYTCKHSFVATGAGDFVGDEAGVVHAGQTCWYACRKGREIRDGKGCAEWERDRVGVKGFDVTTVPQR